MKIYNVQLARLITDYGCVVYALAKLNILNTANSIPNLKRIIAT